MNGTANQQHRPGLAPVNHFDRNMHRSMRIELGDRYIDLATRTGLDSFARKCESFLRHDNPW